MAHTASTGSAKRTVDVQGKRLGIKRFGGQFVHSGEIILRQRGSQFYPGKNTMQGRDFTIFATKEGFVAFRRMSGYKRDQKYVDIVEAVASVSIPEVKATVSEVSEIAKPKAKAVKKTSAPKTKESAE